MSGLVFGCSYVVSHPVIQSSVLSMFKSRAHIISINRSTFTAISCNHKLECAAGSTDYIQKGNWCPVQTHNSIRLLVISNTHACYCSRNIVTGLTSIHSSWQSPRTTHPCHSPWQNLQTWRRDLSLSTCLPYWTTVGSQPPAAHTRKLSTMASDNNP